ncbi:baculoviral IAP repeat-containing protein 7-B-like [Cloeon dipterum]|uniref:baculoviral IAP repeat-containing protein 7-B-like n=1 Tax=Cloeon dipterum TaxID=197152 RepID=UPI00321FE971
MAPWKSAKSAAPSTRKANAEENPHGSNLNLNFAMHRLFSFPYIFLRDYFIPLHTMAELGFFYVNENTLRCNFCNIIVSTEELTECFSLGLENAEKMILEKQKNCKLGEANSKNVPMGRRVSEMLNYKYESHRLYSLLKMNDWQHVDPFSLAKSGFYYTGDQDNVRCAFCNLEVRGWEEEDTADGEHRRWNPNCPFLCNSQSVPNIAIGDERTQVQRDGIARINTGSNPFAELNVLEKYGPRLYFLASILARFHLTAQDLNIHDWSAPLNPHFVTLKSRINSFKEFWPKSHRQTPLELAKAGFFYTGIGDRVVCFHCNLGLKDWDPNDDPSVQHSKWNSCCNYLIMCLKSRMLHFNQNTDVPEITDSSASKGRGKRDLHCLKCRFNNVSKVNLPCGHMTICESCAEDSCRICDKEIIIHINVPGFAANL